MGDEDIGKPKLAAQILEQVDHLRLDRASSAETASSHAIRSG
jgi:hypothetical protein